MNNSTWVFTGGEVTRNEAPELYSFRNYINLFEEYLRWQTAGNKTEKMERFVTNVGYKGQTLVDILETYEERIIPLKPNYLVYVLGIEEYNEYIFCDKKFQKMMESFVSVVSRDLDKNSEIIFLYRLVIYIFDLSN